MLNALSFALKADTLQIRACGSLFSNRPQWGPNFGKSEINLLVSKLLVYNTMILVLIVTKFQSLITFCTDVVRFLKRSEDNLCHSCYPQVNLNFKGDNYQKQISKAWPMFVGECSLPQNMYFLHIFYFAKIVFDIYQVGHA